MSLLFLCIVVFVIVVVVLYYLGHKKRASVFLAYLYFFLSKFKKLYEFCGKNQIICLDSASASIFFRLGITEIFGIEDEKGLFQAVHADRPN